MSPETTSPHIDFWMAEDDLARALGVDRGTVKRHRPDAPTGGVRMNGKAIEWSEAAASALAVRLTLPPPVFQKNAAPAATADVEQKTPPPDPAASTPAALPSGVEELTVFSKPVANGRHFANPHIIKAQRANKDVVDVRVLDSGKYQPLLWDGSKPMTLRAKKSLAGNWWDLVSREPRWRGRP